MEETYQDVVAVRNFGLYNFKLIGITEPPSPRLLESVRREIVVKVIHQEFMRSSFDYSWTFKSDYVHGMTIELSKTEDFNSKYDYFQTPIDKPSDYFIRSPRYFIYYPIDHEDKIWTIRQHFQEHFNYQSEDKMIIEDGDDKITIYYSINF